MSSEQFNREVDVGMLVDEATIDAGALQLIVRDPECLPFISLQAPVVQSSSLPSDALGAQLSDTPRDASSGSRGLAGYSVCAM